MLQLRNISKEYHTGDLVQKALDQVSLDLRDSEFVAVLGPSGSGKTTFLNIVGGLDRYDSGDLIINGVSTKRYKDRDWDAYRNHAVGFVFQSYQLIPHQTVLANVELALTISGIGAQERRQRAQEALEKVGLGDQVHKLPSQLSGGQMQRVAIARALVNDPDILLTDEPTGALDTETSIQVMDLLKEVARDRLVVMVTHNPDLARQYATRIVTLKDGKITGDTDPFQAPAQAAEEAVHKKLGKASMGFRTALQLSFRNLRTKKARTILVAFAGSIGIIGIALILSLSAGVNRYIHDTEEKTLSQYPIQITSTSFDLSSFLTGGGQDESSKAGSGTASKSAQVKEIPVVQDMLKTMNANDLESLRTYLDSGKTGISKYTRAIEYSYDITPQIYRMDGKKIRKVNPNDVFESIGMGSSNMMLSGTSGMNAFFKLPQTASLYRSQYKVKAGRWPKTAEECVVVTRPGGGVTDFLLYTLGLRDASRLDKYVQDFSKGKTVTVTEKAKGWTYQDLMKGSFRVIGAYERYSRRENQSTWTDRSDDEAFLRKVVQKGRKLKVVGVVTPVSATEGGMLDAGIWYTDGLTEELRKDAAKSEIVKEQLTDKSRNVLTGKAFGAKDLGGADLAGLFTVDEKALQKAFTLDTSRLRMDPATLSSALSVPDLQRILRQNLAQVDTDKLSKRLLASLSSMDPAISQEQMSAIVAKVAAGYAAYQKDHPVTDMNQLAESVAAYLSSEEGQKLISQTVSETVDRAAIEKQLRQAASGYEEEVTAALQKAFQELAGQMAQRMTRAMAASMSNFTSAFHVDPRAFAQAFKLNMDESEMKAFLTTMLSSGTDTLDANLKDFGYAADDDLRAVTIYPKDFDAKEQVTKILNRYNEKMRAAGQKEKVITYTDVVGTLMSSVTRIVNAISYVLIAFVSISLVVSSIMIGVITYISVLERRREIGILRAIGASRRNVGQVFNAETFITGLLAGLMGVGISLILLIPLNMIIGRLTEVPVRAYLPPLPALILVLLSVGLTLLGGLIPARKASKSDPVAALRSE